MDAFAVQAGVGVGVATQVSYAVHLLFAGLWAGGAAFVAAGLVPLAASSTVGVDAADSLAGTYVLLARASALITLLTGAQMALSVYGADGLFVGRGHLVVAMVALWVVLAALSEVGVARFRAALAERKVRTAAADARPFLRGAAVAGAALLLLGGYLAA
jgi:hypothetical protein